MNDLPPPQPSTPPPPPPPPLHGGPPGYPPPPVVPGAPPGYTPYNTNPAAAYVKRIGGLAKAIQILVVCIIVVGVLGALVTLGQRSVFRDYLDGEATRSEADDALATIALPGALASLLQVAVIVLTMIWMFRLAKNLQLLGRTGATWKPGWAIGGWFLPPVLFVIPFLMFRELWRGSDPQTPPHAPNWKQAAVAPIVTLWWLLYGVAGVLLTTTQIGSFGRTEIEDVAEFYADSGSLTLVATLIQLASAVAYVLLVRQLTARQRAATGER